MMHKTLQLHLEATLIARAERYAQARGQPIDQLVADYFAGLEAPAPTPKAPTDSITERAALLASLRGLLVASEGAAGIGPG